MVTENARRLRHFRGPLLGRGMTAVHDDLEPRAGQPLQQVLAFPERHDHVLLSREDQRRMIEMVVGASGKGRIAHRAEEAVPRRSQALDEEMGSIDLGIRLGKDPST